MGCFPKNCVGGLWCKKFQVSLCLIEFFDNEKIFLASLFCIPNIQPSPLCESMSRTFVVIFPLSVGDDNIVFFRECLVYRFHFVIKISFFLFEMFLSFCHTESKSLCYNHFLLWKDLTLKTETKNWQKNNFHFYHSIPYHFSTLLWKKNQFYVLNLIWLNPLNVWL